MDLLKNRSKHLIDKPGSSDVASKYGKNKIEICFDDLGFPDFNDWVPRWNTAGTPLTNIVTPKAQVKPQSPLVRPIKVQGFNLHKAALLGQHYEKNRILQLTS